MLDRIRHRFGKVVRLDDMRLLALTGTNQIGRLRYTLPGSVYEAGKRADVGLSLLLGSDASNELFEYLVDRYLQSGISGFQPKVMVPNADRPGSALNERATLVAPDLIVKASGDDYPHLAQNEFLCMEAARRAGLSVPEFWLSETRQLFVMARFDLAQGRQLGFEDMAVLMNRTAEEKYTGSYENIVTAIRLYCGANAPESCQRFFEYLTLTVMVRNGDAHLKNFGLLYTDPISSAPALSPLFDVVTTTIYKYQNRHGVELVDRELALKLEKTRGYPDRKSLLAFGRQVCGVSKPEEVLERIGDAMADTLHLHGPTMEPTLLDALRQEWDGGRRSMAPDRVFQGTPGKRGPSRPKSI
ncbi:type II toxin-antitoxin system HipA family toxin [Cupriavidus sp. AU9028]|uniref:type II toxin-antitoxin system HipA family toxin n=1 Tax=Cupriavidus sp. AU9028 TaxID=2871157 RepID=UPI002107B3D8|nr:HipA domain-containing protein [Cupriavidus sp. AU9028]